MFSIHVHFCHGATDVGCVPLVESKKGFGVTDFSDFWFSMERQVKKKKGFITPKHEMSRYYERRTGDWE